MAALFFSLLVVYISVAFPVMPVNHSNVQVSEHTSLAFESSLDKVIFLQGPSSPVQLDGWKTEAKIPGLIFRKTNPVELLVALPGLKNRWIRDVETYSPCKRTLLYPYHEFL